MIGEIIAIGDELTSGRIMNTTSGFAARKLFDAGHTIHAMSTIGDTPSLIGEALIQALDRVDFIIVTGGLGSTDDDITNEAVSHALNRPTMPDLTILAWIREHLGKHTVSPHNPLEKLAWLPGGAEVLEPESHVAGYQLIHDDTPIFFLPGVPDEMMDLMTRIVLPKLEAWSDGQEGAALRTLQRIYKVFAMAESEINRKINALQLPDDVRIGYYPVYPDVHVSVLSRSRDYENGREIFSSACSEVKKSLGNAVYGTDGDELEAVIGDLLRNSGLKLSIAESCTGGLMSHRITKIPGSSDYFAGGAVTYSNELKQDILGVDETLLSEFGAVSNETAEAMARGVRKRCDTDIGISITGIAGPDGGSPEKPVGTVYIGISHADTTSARKLMLRGNRNRIQAMAVQSGLNLLRLFLLDLIDAED